MDFKRLFTRFLAATSTLLPITFPGKSGLRSPVRTVVRLIATLPVGAACWVLPYPLIPASYRTETDSISILDGAAMRNFKHLIALLAGPENRWLSLGWDGLPLLRLTDSLRVFWASLSPLELSPNRISQITGLTPFSGAAPRTTARIEPNLLSATTFAQLPSRTIAASIRAGLRTIPTWTGSQFAWTPISWLAAMHAGKRKAGWLSHNNLIIAGID